MQDILVGLAKGWSDAEISEFLFLGTSTVHRGTKAIYKRLGASGRTHAVAMAYDYAILRTRAMRLELAQAAGLRVAA
jgi:DNA-binding NarL/FixJ family response regulator